MIRRVKIYKVIFASLGFSKILLSNVNTLQGSMAGSQVVFLANGGIFITSYRDVKLALAVDAPQAIEAGFVEVNKSGGFFYRVFKLMLRSEVVIILAIVLLVMFLQLFNQGGDITLDDLPSVD